MNSKITLLLAFLCFLFISQTLGHNEGLVNKDNSDGITTKKQAGRVISKGPTKKVARRKSPKNASRKMLITRIK